MVSLPNRLVAVVAALGLVLSACSGDNSEPEPETEAPASPSAEPPDLPQGLSAVSTIRTRVNPGDGLDPGFWLSGDHVVAPQRSQVTAFDQRGDEVWRWRPRQGMVEICEASGTVNEDGIAALRLRRRGHGCDTTAALDLRSGELLWHHSQALSKYENTDYRVSISDTTVHSSGECGEVMRFAARSGRRLDPIAPRDVACGHESWHDDTYVAVVVDPSDNADVELDTGWIWSGGEGEIQVQLWDSSTRKRLWSRTRQENEVVVHRIVNHDPLIWEAEELGHRHVWTVERGRLHQPLSPGLGLGSAPEYEPLGIVDGLFVIHLPGREPRAYDPETGEEVSRIPLPDATSRPLGIHDDRIIVARSRFDHGRDKEVTWLEGIAPRDPSDVVTWGVLPQSLEFQVSTEVVDGRVHLLSDGTYTAVDLPEGSSGSVEVPVSAPSDPVGTELAFGAADPLELCEAVAPETLELLGYRHPDFPAPSDCRWRETREPRYADRELLITTDAQVGENQDEADQAATKRLREQRQRSDFRRRAWSAVDSLGDEAWIATYSSGNGATNTVSLQVRHANLTIEITARVSSDVSRTSGAVVGFAAVEATALSALGDIHEELGLEPPQLPDAAPGAVTRVGKVCRNLGPLAAEVTGRARADVVRGDQRRVTCLWGEELQVSAYAVPGSTFSGAAADEMAAQAMDRYSDDEPLKGIGDVARIRRYVGQDGAYRAHDVNAHAGNVVVVVQLTRESGGTREQMDADVRRLAKATLESVG